METAHEVAIKLVLFSVIDGQLMLYLPARKIPRTYLRFGHTLEDELNHLITQSGFSDAHAFNEQLYTISDGGTKSHSISVVYYMLMAQHMISSGKRVGWVGLAGLEGKLPDDQILVYAIQRLQWKIEYTNVVYSLLPHDFTLGELQRVYEAILDRKLDKRNFRKKILSLHMLVDTGRKTTHGRARPAEIYRFKKREPTIVEVL